MHVISFCVPGMSGWQDVHEYQEHHLGNICTLGLHPEATACMKSCALWPEMLGNSDVRCGGLRPSAEDQHSLAVDQYSKAILLSESVSPMYVLVPILHASCSFV